MPLVLTEGEHAMKFRQGESGGPEQILRVTYQPIAAQAEPTQVPEAKVDIEATIGTAVAATQAAQLRLQQTALARVTEAPPTPEPTHMPTPLPTPIPTAEPAPIPVATKPFPDFAVVAPRDGARVKQDSIATRVRAVLARLSYKMYRSGRT